MIKAPEVWELSDQGSGIVVALFVTGVQVDHPDLEDAIIGGRNFSDDGPPEDYSDRLGHGTSMAGILAAKANGQGIVGIAPKVKLLVLKVFGQDGSVKFEDLIRAMDYAISWRGPQNERVKIFAMPLGSPMDDPLLHEAIKRAVANQILLICGAGNDGDQNGATNEIAYPACYPEVASVGAVDPDKHMARFSNSNNEIDFVAPGVDIKTTAKDSKYIALSGTASTVPIAAGAAALVSNLCEKEYGRSLSESELYFELCKRTVPLGYGKSLEGHGLLLLTR
ncbi:major intracellular serine protease [Paenibacillus polymyxa]|uniref:S8 family peptidase n=1 Tax=Paenibacillus polymyxa TaxID=1406 RepID=UPI00278F9E3E|nr:S8 family peptidase [Paenibacillus polymyxa]MDQ0049261.1 major intracellular serine protease [Paenibacillus polymyxa]